MSAPKTLADSTTLEMPAQLLKALAYDPAAGSAFDDLSTEQQRQFIDFVTAARTSSEREERTAQVVHKLLKGEKP